MKPQIRVIYLNGQQEDPRVEHITFPTGEKHIRIHELKREDDIVIVYNDSSGDIMKLALAVDICKRAKVHSIALVMAFVPYARQDRVATEGDPFSIRIFAKFINSLSFDYVTMVDPHSDVTPALFERSSVVPQYQIAHQAVTFLTEFMDVPVALVAPDLGAAKKIKALQKYLKALTGLEYPVIQCDKTRCLETGKISGFKILDGDPEGMHCLMVDDICDGGGTFMGLSEVLWRAGANGQSLFVTHGIFSKGVAKLQHAFEYIFASNSFGRDAIDGVHLLETGEFA